MTVRTGHARALPHRANDTDDLQHATNALFVRGVEFVDVQLDDDLGHREELVRALAVVYERGQYSTDECMRLIRVVASEIVLNERGDHAWGEGMKGLGDRLRQWSALNGR